MHTDRYNQFFTSFLFFVAVVFISYSNTLYVPWILDDQPNIIENPPIHLQQLSLQALTNTFYAYPDSPGTLYRPVACLSFALNWFVGQDDPFGYHVVNISIHILTAFFLYLACLHLVQLVVSSDTFSQHRQFVAFFAALLWAMNPMQTQAVTYIVQRMAALAALFSIIGIFFFLKVRIATSLNKKIFFSICCLLSFFCALGSKENAVIFPLSLILIECIFFKDYRKILPHDKNKKIFFLFSFFLILLTLFLISGISFPGLNYQHRTFTLTQRVLTAPRILVFYLSQIFFPISSRLSVEHDIILSTSLFSPWTTIPSGLICIFLIILGFSCREKNKLLSLALLFYFLNHAVESTILHLELFFEHRNYLPSLFLFLPIAAWWASLLDSKKNYYVRIGSISSSVIVLIFFGINTYNRNQAWSSALTLWQDAHQKAPNSNRAAINLAKEYIQAGDIEAALLLSEQSYHLSQPTKNYSQALSLNGQGVIANIKGDNQKASQLFQQSLEFVPDYGEAKKNLILSLCKQHRFQEALTQFSHYTDHNLEGIILLWTKQPEKALAKFRSASDILEVENITGIGKALSMVGNHEQADFYLRQAASYSPFSSLIQIENLLRADRIKDAEIACEQMFSFYPAFSIFQSFSTEDTLRTPLDRKLVMPFVLQQAKKYAATK